GVGYTYTDSKDELTNLPLEGRGRHRWNLNLRVEEKSSGISLSVFAVVFGKQPYYCIKNPFWCNPDLPSNFDSLETILNQESQSSIQNLFGTLPTVLSDYCAEKNISYCTTSPTYGYRMVNPYTNLNLRLSQRFLGHFQWFVGVDNALDAWDLQYNPQRPKFYYFGLDGKFAFSDVKLKNGDS
ncbi:TonB-dependent receptor, partial [Leptospira biflexa]